MPQSTQPHRSQSDIDVIVGIPSYMEAASIESLTRRLDSLIQTLPDAGRILLANSDNCSPDSTSTLFEKTSTRTPKVALQTDRGKRGKGWNFKRLFGLALETGARGLICLDADLEVIPEDWLPAYLKALDDGADLVVPLYPRFWYDGNMTNQIVAPLVASTGHAIRQPIGGDFAFSRHALQTFSGIEWPAAAHGFGVDSFLVLRSLELGLNTVQTQLSTAKIHSWRSDTADEVVAEMENKFCEVVSTVLAELSRRRPMLSSTSPIQYPPQPSLGTHAKDYDPSHLVETADQAWRQLVQTPDLLSAFGLEITETAPRLDNAHWADILFYLLRCAFNGNLRDTHIKTFERLFYVRIGQVLPTLTDADVEPMVTELAQMMAEHARHISFEPEA